MRQTSFRCVAYDVCRSAEKIDEGIIPDVQYLRKLSWIKCGYAVLYSVHC